MVTDSTPIRLTELTSCGGCAAKWGASLLRGLLAEQEPPAPLAELLVGLSPFDDAAVLQLTNEVALVSTTDFFPPLVDDADDYGAIAAANACSDVFAMGGDVVLALNIAAFPENLDQAVISRILAAAARVVRDAGGVVAGGHTIRSAEPVFGLAVQGVVKPGSQLTKGGARPGDVMMVSKPIGTGIALASGDGHAISAAIAGMRRLNRDASLALRSMPGAVHAVTDVTGFGLAGHVWEMVERSEVRAVVQTDAVPAYPGVIDAVERGVRTGGAARNRDYVEAHITVRVGETMAALAYDPQTSGGLLASVDAEAVDALTSAGFTRIGTIEAGPAGVELR